MEAINQSGHIIRLDCKYKGKPLHEVDDIDFLQWYLQFFLLILRPKKTKEIIQSLPNKFK